MLAHLLDGALALLEIEIHPTALRIHLSDREALVDAMDAKRLIHRPDIAGRLRLGGDQRGGQKPGG
ncbi:MAG: hypothetical protein ACR2P7_03910 [bacterium]